MTKYPTIGEVVSKLITYKDFVQDYRFVAERKGLDMSSARAIIRQALNANFDVFRGKKISDEMLNHIIRFLNLKLNIPVSIAEEFDVILRQNIPVNPESTNSSSDQGEDRNVSIICTQKITRGMDGGITIKPIDYQAADLSILKTANYRLPKAEILPSTSKPPLEVLANTEGVLTLTFHTNDLEQLEIPSEVFRKFKVAIQTTSSKEKEMTSVNTNHLDSSIPVQTITYVYGVPAEQVSNEQIFERIASLELQIADLSKIKAKSSQLTKKIQSLKEHISDLVAIVDARE